MFKKPINTLLNKLFGEELKTELVYDLMHNKTFYINGEFWKCRDSFDASYGNFNFSLKNSEGKTLFLDRVWVNTFGKGDFYYRVTTNGEFLFRLGMNQFNLLK